MTTLTKTRVKKAKIIKQIVISPDNTKLGKIPSFSLPAITACPGATPWCVKLCYADKVSRIYRNAAKSYQTNYQAAKNNKDFVLLLNTELAALSRKGKTTFRMHVAGDFFDVKYIYDWVNVAKANPSIMFYGYTRSWSVPNMLTHLEALRCLPNVILFASTDVSTIGTAPAGWREAYAGDIMPVRTKMLACLEQAGKVTSCDKCKICFNPKSTVDIYFKTH